MSVSRVDRVPYALAGFGETLTHDLAFGVPAAQSFFPAQKFEDVIAHIDRHAYPRAEVAATLDASARRFNAPEVVLNNIERLRESKTYVVATGQQAGFLGGPLYSLHKALSVIKLAQKLEADFGGRAYFVPVFWVAGDDHDMAEIDHAYILQPDANVARVKAAMSSESVGCSACGAFIDRSEQNLVALRSELTAALNNEALANEFVQLYSTQSMSDAFTTLMYKWLGEFGLVIGQSQDLRKFGTEILLRELNEFDVTTRLIQEAAVALQSAGYKAGFSGQGREGPHFFITSEPSKIRAHLDLAGGRDVAEFQERSAAFAQRGEQPRRFKKSELTELIRARPELFSCAAALRPVLQDTVFPVVAAVLGPGEIAYWAQLKKVHDHFGAVWPVIVPRATVTLIDGAGEKAMRKLGIAPGSPDLFLETEALTRKILVSATVGGSLDARIAKIESELSAMEAEVAAVDGGLKPLFDKSRERIGHELSRIAEKTRASLGQREGAGAARLAYLASLVRPKKMPQERVLSVAPLMARYPTLARDLAEAIDVFVREHLVVTLG
jgi:bacillithiol biosynthesis cysteine-adding enzyme BshC